MLAPDTFWLACLEYFENELSAQQFNTWIKPLRLQLSHDSPEPALTLIAPNRFVLQWVKDNFLNDITQMAENYFERPVQLQLELAGQVPAKASTSAAGNNGINSPPITAGFDAPVGSAQKAPKAAGSKEL